MEEKIKLTPLTRAADFRFWITHFRAANKQVTARFKHHRVRLGAAEVRAKASTTLRQPIKGLCYGLLGIKPHSNECFKSETSVNWIKDAF
jgi:hypothetical protein